MKEERLCSITHRIVGYLIEIFCSLTSVGVLGIVAANLVYRWVPMSASLAGVVSCAMPAPGRVRNHISVTNVKAVFVEVLFQATLGCYQSWIIMIQPDNTMISETE